jgi:hypothetical protein
MQGQYNTVLYLESSILAQKELYDGVRIRYTPGRKVGVSQGSDFSRVINRAAAKVTAVLYSRQFASVVHDKDNRHQGGCFAILTSTNTSLNVALIYSCSLINIQ